MMKRFFLIISLFLITNTGLARRSNKPKYLLAMPAKTNALVQDKKSPDYTKPILLEEQPTESLSQQLLKLEEHKKSVLQKAQMQQNQTIDEIRQQHEEAIKELQKSFAQHTQKVQKEIEAQTKEQIAQGEIELLSKYLEAKQKKVAPQFKNDLLETWKTKKRNELLESVTYLGPILQQDPELAQSINTKQEALDTKITQTESIHDSNYKEATEEIKSLSLMYSIQKQADTMLYDILKNMNIPSEKAHGIRLLILYELPPLVEKLAQTSETISHEEIKTLVMRAINEAQQKQTSEKIEPKEQKSEVNEELENLKKKVVEYEIKLTQEQQEKERLKSVSKQADSLVSQLQKKLEDVHAEKISLEITVKTTKEELYQTKRFDAQRLQQLQKDLQNVKQQLENQTKRLLEVQVLLETHKQNLTLAKLSKNEKQRKISELEEYLQKTRRELLETQIKAQQVKDLQNKTTSLQTELTQLKLEHITTQKSLQESLQTIEKLKHEQKLEREIYALKYQVLKQKSDDLNKDKVTIKQQLAKIAHLKSNLEQIKEQEIIDEKSKLLSQEKYVVKAQMKNFKDKKQLFNDEKIELKKIYNKITALKEKALQESERFSKQELHNSVAKQKQEAQLNYKLNRLLYEIKQPLEQMQVQTAESDDLLDDELLVAKALSEEEPELLAEARALLFGDDEEDL